MVALTAVMAVLALTAAAMPWWHFASPSQPTVPRTSFVLVPPQGSRPVVVVATPPAGGGRAPQIGYLVKALHERGLGTLQLSEGATGDTATQVRAAVTSLGRDARTARVPVGLLAFGHGTRDVWQLLADPPRGMRSAVLIDVPGTGGLDFRKGTSVADLSLNLEQDKTATSSHHLVHEALRRDGVTHQVIVYGDVAADGLDQSSPHWQRATAIDVAQRAAEWLLVRDGQRNLDASTDPQR